MSVSYYLDGDTMVIVEGSTEIPANIFLEAGITNVIIPDSISSIGEYAFDDN